MGNTAVKFSFLILSIVVTYMLNLLKLKQIQGIEINYLV